jgi:hypothetical protein
MNAPKDPVQEAFDLGFRHFFLTDIQRANECDVRMGTFVLCAAFLDALSTTYSAGLKVPGRLSGKWARFFDHYFPPAYKPVGDAYASFRSLLLHNYSASGLAFTHGPENEDLHLQRQGDLLVLHRESFVRDVTKAFEAFQAEVGADATLHARIAKHFATTPPMGLREITRKPGGDVAGVRAASGTGPAVKRAP